MPKIRFTGTFSESLASFWTINKIAMQTYLRHARGQKIAHDWDANTEIGIRFWRHQFTKAMTHASIETGREIFNSLQTETDDQYPVPTEICEDCPGTWYRPQNAMPEANILYFHGGGYSFYGPISERFAAMLSHHTNAQLFAARYRLTPEHPHSAQEEDALRAWQYLSDKVGAKNIIVMGDSAGGHMALMLLQQLHRLGLEQPRLCVALCPWTDIGDRGNSLHENDHYDLVQGWMALKFGKWLDPNSIYGREALSPIYQDYSGLAPIYIQTGGREILHDMIREFAGVQADKGAQIKLDIFDDMPHNFQVYDSMKSSSQKALKAIRLAVQSTFSGDEK